MMVSVLACREGASWVVQAIEEDVASQGASMLDALADLGRMFDARDAVLLAARVHPNPRAPAAYEKAFNDGYDVGVLPLGAARVAKVCLGTSPFVMNRGNGVYDRIVPVPDDGSRGVLVYADEGLRALVPLVIELVRGGLLIVDESDGLFVSFVVFALHAGPATRDGSQVEGALYRRVFDGSGPVGTLRDLRHTFWGEADNGGYIFNPDPALIADAFAKLRRWFDLP